MKWEPVIGIEVHVELETQSKMFCGCAVDFEAEPNTNVCPTCLGLPGALPVPNRKAIEWITKIGLAFNCSISERSQFHRKNYFYSDQPKNYQISQFDVPVCHDGWIDVTVDGETSRIRVNRAHMEEDTGKSIHVGESGRIHSATETLLNFNRAGVPLVEIVSEADIRSAAQARAYAQTLRTVVAALGVSDAKLEEGSIRFDANVSIRPTGTEAFGTKVEVKNMNSFRSLERAVDFEILRQADILDQGGTIDQETRHWDEGEGVTHSMRSKEGSSDYRYFPEPDLLPIEVTDEWRNEIAATLPELPAARAARYMGLGVDADSATSLAGSDALTAMFQSSLAAGAPAQVAANWLTGEVTAWSRRAAIDIADSALTGAHVAQLAGMVAANLLSSTAAKEVLGYVLAGEGDPETVAAAHDLVQINDSGALESAVDQVIGENEDQFARLAGGEDKLIGFFVGQVMRVTGGKADPRAVTDIIRSRIG
ncbi:MAG: Asp-tRNA(Asn)/Glu-tRNA(Gln) amidotransferase subunit GatB [Acidimicrobiia bacterium]|nr:Asp-tRNA(Asn)/Glu-tRNA(Gln) amidotransferase subunit GatB [Acidimicrobiia bacterium]MDH5420984.1 Asp-tRNA(Asn)/Glu-tRNA(Gln) amidotransferase subunit GatB [Acidimicrobiia bacterium]MDH5504285.1 Asp-tRNA(Asn)/Glu-tRNA(Gln) amidotransferase subunit GatB [Acidimicrobiia bacterium]